MFKTIIVVSSLVDSTIREYQSDVDFILFQSLEDLDTYIKRTPIRAESLFFTKDTIPYENTSLNYLSVMLENPFLVVDKIVYITEKQSREVASVNYLIKVKNYTNWEIIEGYLTREYVSGIVNGTSRTDSMNLVRKSIYRVPREAYLRDSVKNISSLQEEYVDDEKYLQNIPDEIPPVEILPERESECEIVHIAGMNTEERTVFSYLAAQYMSFSGKTVIVERDIEYHRLSEYVTKSGVEALVIEIEDLISNMTDTLDKIKRNPSQLICIISTARIEYSYSFLINILYNNLYNDIDYLVRESTFEEVPNTSHYIATLPTTMPDILEACEYIDPVYAHYAKLVGVNLKSLPELRINNSKVLSTIAEDVLGVTALDAIIINVSTLKIGGESGYDLGTILRKGK